MSQPPYREELSRQQRQDAFDVEDHRWERTNQVRDWALLGLGIVLALGWHLLVYAVEPGLLDPDAFLH